MAFRISREPILEAPGFDPGAGALVTFEGRVRDNNEGRKVVRLEYEAFPEMAESEGSRILNEACERYEILSADCVHRVGLLELGDVAVRIDVLAGHRRAAFESCSWIIDEVKRRVPIWKKEHYSEGDSDWINCGEPSEVRKAMR